MADPILYQVGDELPSGKSVGDVKKASSPEYQDIDHSKLVPLLVKAVQELSQKVADKDGEISVLEKKIETIEQRLI